MRRPKKIILLSALLLVSLYGCFKVTFPSYTNRFRLTMAFNIDGQTYSGSSVIEVLWAGQLNMGQGPYSPYIRGQAVFIDLGQRGAIVAVLYLSGGNDRAVGVESLTRRAFSTRQHPIAIPEGVPELSRLTGRRDLAPDNMPGLIWFSNVEDEKSARVVTVGELPSLFGPTARLDAAFIEITTDPIVIDIDQKLPWYRALAYRQKGHSIISEPGFKLKYNMFIGELS